MGFAWTCTTCGHPTTITEPAFKHKTLDLFASNTANDAGVVVGAIVIECPNQACKAQHVSVTVDQCRVHRPTNEMAGLDKSKLTPIGIGRFTFKPTTAHPLSRHVPEAVLADYSEAYLIRTLSPKASATLARRALQGMIRDFWKEVHYTLHQELVAIKDKCDPGLYEAMMGIKSIGNIGAHPEQDVSLIVDIEPGEAQALLDLLHVLDQEWYVARANRADRIKRVTALSASKKDEKGAGASGAAEIRSS
jgi:hypothetical protein